MDDLPPENPAPTPAGRPAGGNGSTHRPPAHGPTHHPATDGLVQILARRWPLIAAVSLLSILAGSVYLLAAKKVYTAAAKLQIDPPVEAQAIAGSTNNANSNQTSADFLQTQCGVIKSSAVLSLALEKLHDCKSLAGVPRPIEALKKAVTAEPVKEGGLIVEVRVDSRDPDDAVKIADAVADGYKRYELNSLAGRAKDLMDLINGGSAQQNKEVADKRSRMREIADELGYAPNLDPNLNPGQEKSRLFLQSVNQSEIVVLSADSAYEEALKAVQGNADLVARVDELEVKGTATSNPEHDLEAFQTELTRQRAKMADDSHQYLSNHPVILADQRRVDDLTVRIVVAAKQCREAARARQAAYEQKLDEARRSESDLKPKETEYNSLRDEVARLERATSDLHDRAGELGRISGAGAINIRVTDAASLQPETKPDKVKTLAIALVMGLMLGVAAACLMDWADDRVRTPADVQAVAGAPVLGAIPEITAGNAADRGQIVHHDPFGEAAESYRTLATAIRYGLPARTKTILITSAVSGDGKSTLVSNLGLSLATSGKKILIIDADFRAPTQHRLFDLKDRIGLSTVLAGGERVERAIQRTEVDGLDVLGCGPVPANPSEVLNDPAFVDAINELADKYDLVLIDSPPVTAVADARVLAVTADVSLLVVRPNMSTRKQIAAARDGLRSVGARLVGVAVNAVGRNSDFGGSSGYYPRGNPVPPRKAATTPSRDVG